MQLMPKSFRYRIVLLLMAIGFLVGVPIQTYVDHVFAKQLLGDRGGELHDLAKSIAAVFVENLKERQHEITFLADSSTRDLANGKPVDQYNDLSYLQKSHPYYSWIGYADAAGLVRQGTGHILEGQSVAARPWFQHGMHGPYVGDLHEALMLSKALPYGVSSEPVRFIDFAAPVRNMAGNAAGVLAAHVHWRWAGEVADVLRPSVHENQHGDILIINKSGQIFFPDDKFG